MSNFRNFTSRSILSLISKFVFIKNLVYFIFLIIIGSNFIFAQDGIIYDIDASIDIAGKKIKILQKISFQVSSTNRIDTLYLTDWSNAYSSTKSPLAQRFVEEYDRSFYLSHKSKLGSTVINSITINGLQTEWERIEDQPDIIRIISKSKNKVNNKTAIFLDYQVLIPDAKFTGYGYNANGDALLRYWYIALSPIYKNKWRPWYILRWEGIIISICLINTTIINFKIWCFTILNIST